MIRYRFLSVWLASALLCVGGIGQTLINVDFGGSTTTLAHGPAAVGEGTNDVWNAYSHYLPRFTPGMAEIPNGRLADLKYADGSPSHVSIAVTNAPGIWGNNTGDPMFDSFMFAPNGSNITVTITGLEPGRYHFVLYGHADADVGPEQNSVFWLSTKVGAPRLGPVSTSGVIGWRAGQPWQDGRHYAIFRDVTVEAKEPVTIDVAPGPGGLAVINGLQIYSRGTAPPRLATGGGGPAASGVTNLLFKEIHYDGSVGGSEARFKVTVDVESLSTNELSATLFEGALALLSPKLPAGWRILPEGQKFIVTSGSPGAQRLELELTAKVNRAEPWNELVFVGPPAAIATISVKPGAPGTELHLTAGTSMEESGDSSKGSDRPIKGVIGADGRVGLRWQNSAAEINREAVVAADTETAVQFTPAVIRLSTAVRFDVLQGRLAEVKLAIPAEQSLTKVSGDAVRDWHLDASVSPPTLVVEFLRPVEKSATLTLLTEQPVTKLPMSAVVSAPQPLNQQREQGGLNLSAEDVLARVESQTSLRQVNAAAGELAAFRFSSRPASVQVALTRVEPTVAVSDRIRARLEETRLRIWHGLSLKIDRAGLYSIETTAPAGFTVAEVTGDGVEDWKVADGRLKVDFSHRVIGQANLTVLLEQALTATPAEIAVIPLRIAGAEKESAMVGASAAAGFNLKTGALLRAREIPVTALPDRNDELLAFRADTGDWRITLSTERPAPRLVAEVFNLITVGDGLVGGSATIRFAIVNQGVQNFRIRLPEHWRNIEFTGANIRRTDHQTNLWTVALQDKAWDAYTLVLTYDYPFDAKQATLDAAGSHPLEVERETGSEAVTAAPGLEIKADAVKEPFRIIDPTELASTDRALVTRPIVLAGRYEGSDFALKLTVTRNEQVAVLDAVADRAQMTSVITDRGETLTQASFMVKNNDRQFQRFRLPLGATLWGAAVNGEPVKADRDGEWVLVSLPRNADRDRVFAVDLNYAQQLGDLARLHGLVPKKVELTAPETDVPGTYAEWEIYAPASRHVASFDGNMTVARGTAYGLHDAWQKFTGYYSEFWSEHAAELIIGTAIVVFLSGIYFMVRRSGFRGFVQTILLAGLVAILLGMLLPATSSAQRKSRVVKAAKQLSDIGGAARSYAAEHNGAFPPALDDLLPYLSSAIMLEQPETHERYTYMGAGKSEETPDAVVAFGISPNGTADVLLGDGSVQQTTAEKLSAMLAKPTQPADGSVLTTSEPADADSKARSTIMDPQMMRRYGLVTRQMGDKAAKKLAEAEGKPSQAPAGAGGFGAGLGATLQTESKVQLSAPPVAQAVPMLGNLFTSKNPGQLATTPAVAGLRSLRIEIPKTGRHLHFTRTLSLQGKPSVINFTVMSSRGFVAWRTLFQAVTFLTGLVFIYVQWGRTAPSSLWLACGVALALLGAGSLFIAWQVLHWVFILAIPLTALVAVVWLVIRLFRMFPPKRVVTSTPPPSTDTGAAVAAAALLFLAFIPFHDANAAASSFTNTISVVSAEFTGQAGERSATFDAVIELTANGTNQTATLFGKDVGLEEFSVTRGDARLWRNGDQVGVLMPAPGTATAHLKMVVKVGGDIGRRTLDFGLPPALGSRVSLTLNEPDAEVDFPAALAFTRATNGVSTKLDAVMGSGGRFGLSWSPHLKRASEGATTVFGHQSSLITVGGGVVATKTQFEFSTPQGELRSLRILLPPGHRLLRVGGDSIRTWDTAGAARNEVTVELSKPSSAAKITVETEKNLDALPASVVADVPRPMDVKRATGVVAIRGADEVGLSVDKLDGLERIESTEFEKGFGKEGSGTAGAWRFLRPDFTLNLKAETLTPKLEATLRNEFTVGSDQIGIQAYLAFKITRAGTFTLRLAIPTDVQVENVACDAMRTWDEHTVANGREIEIALKEKTLGAIAVGVRMSRAISNLPPQISLTGLHPLGVEKLTGFVSAAAEPGIGLKTAALNGLTEIPVAELGGGASKTAASLAYKYLLFQPAPAAPWSLSLGVETMDSWVRAEVATSATIAESLVTGRTVVRYDIQNAPLKDFSVRVPVEWRNVEIQGGAIRRRDSATNGNSVTWKVELQSKVRGDFRLVVNWELPRSATNRLILGGLEALGAERESGWLALQTRGQLQLTPRGTNDALLRADAAELPVWLAESSGGSATPALVFRYLRPGWVLPLDVDRYADAAVLQALADETQLRTVVAEDGQWMTRIELKIRNNGRQHLEIALPTGASVWSAFVDGQPVRPAQRNGRLLLPLEASQDRDAPVSIQLTYVGTDSFPKGRGSVKLESPRLDVPLKDARWEVFLPPDYNYDKFGGTMTYEGADTVPVAQDFTLGAYKRQEAEQEAAENSAVTETLAKVRRGLQLNSFGEASRLDYYRNPLSNSGNRKDEATAREVDSLADTVHRAQSSNLIEAQKSYLYNNSDRLGRASGAAGENAKERGGAYDAEVALKQAAQLEKAQAVAVARVTPLRVNLPKYGIRHSFTQVLQTEVDRPLTITLRAANDRETSWLGLTARSIAGFAALWIGAIAAISFRNMKP
jgi:hypothetical protein